MDRKNVPPKRILIISDSAQDVFFEHLSKSAASQGYIVDRQSLSEALKANLNDYDILLSANISKSDTAKLSSCLDGTLRPKLASCSGGKKDYQPYLSIWYGPHDCDDFMYKSWLEFEEKLFTEQPRQEKLLRLSAANQNGYDVYESTGAYRVPLETVSNDLSQAVATMCLLSRRYLIYVRDWLHEVQRMSFPIRFELPPNKLFRSLSFVPELREYDGLPLCKEGDKIIFRLDHSYLHASIKSIEEEQLVVVFSDKIAGKELNLISSYMVSPGVNDHLLSYYAGRLFDIHQPKHRRISAYPKDLIEGLGWNNYDPIYAGHDGGYFSQKQTISLDKKTERILRDPSQVQALLDIMSPKFFTLMEGPAGTGKTFVSAVAVKQFFLQKKKILILSHSNKGTDNLLEEVARHVDHKHLFRLGKDPNVISSKTIKFNSTEHFEDFAKVLRGGEPMVIASTINSLSSGDELASFVDIVIIDEATRSLFFEIWPAICKAREKVVLIGDGKQLGNIKLPPSVTDFLSASFVDPISGPEIEEAISRFNDGLFLLAKQFMDTRLLNCNRRSLPKIGSLVSQVFYEGQLEIGRFNPYKDGELAFYDTAGKFPDERRRTSYCNPKEANFVIKKFLERAIAHIKAGGDIRDLAIIAPYQAQINYLKKHLRKHLLYHRIIKSQVNEENIDDILNEVVVTVDAMQGSERKIIFISLTRSNAEGIIGFNRDIRRLNVAASRPQELLIIVGDAQTFLNCGEEAIVKAFARIVEIIKREGSYCSI